MRYLLHDSSRKNLVVTSLYAYDVDDEGCVWRQRNQKEIVEKVDADRSDQYFITNLCMCLFMFGRGMTQ